MKITEKNYTITTIYFDGQFWCALIEKNDDGKTILADMSLELNHQIHASCIG